MFASAVETQEDRRQALEKAGISVQSSGIKVEKDKYYLVNLNADPALNELLVYYLRQPSGVTRIGRDGEVADIQLSGVGIQVVLSLLQLFSKEMIEYITLCRTSTARSSLLRAAATWCSARSRPPALASTAPR